MNIDKDNVEQVLENVVQYDETYIVQKEDRPVAIILPYWLYEDICEEIGTKP